MDDLERELRDLSAWLGTPEPPDVTARVRARLAAAPPAGRQIDRRRWRYALAAALAALLVAVLPPGRAALADAMAGLLRFAGVTISTSPVGTPPSGVPSPPPGQRSATLDEARRLVRFPIRTPTVLGPPEQTLLADPDDTGGHRVASLLYRAGTLRLDIFDGRLDPVFVKQAGGSDTEWTQVGTAQAIWIDGPHPISYTGRDGVVRQASARLAAATLIWEDAGVTYRLEGDLTMAEAVTIATTLQ
ncbi:hypothetical protein O7605_27680 [Verrucosispora sp. WMMA2121]|uniref:hypothetical protein n=1 Tax=Verrucosispora sp. WMMA2121 TaxID=3015164 RepID=UPI0022B6DA1C|nr:hypothetical protein [Verrucosispora sp. WMMA2121]MCZ7423293.1 hypothetical protein [Verrucosispora sp. WMMA2121]